MRVAVHEDFLEGDPWQSLPMLCWLHLTPVRRGSLCKELCHVNNFGGRAVRGKRVQKKEDDDDDANDDDDDADDDDDDV